MRIVSYFRRDLSGRVIGNPTYAGFKLICVTPEDEEVRELLLDSLTKDCTKQVLYDPVTRGFCDVIWIPKDSPAMALFMALWGDRIVERV